MNIVSKCIYRFYNLVHTMHSIPDRYSYHCSLAQCTVDTQCVLHTLSKVGVMISESVGEKRSLNDAIFDAIQIAD